MTTFEPLEFDSELPGAGWRLGTEQETRDAGAQLLVFHESPGTFVSNITVTSDVYENMHDVTSVADAQIQLIAQAADSVELVARDEIGSAASPGLVQLLNITQSVEDKSLRLAQCQVLLAGVDAVSAGNRMLVYLLCLTAEADVFGSLEADFERFVARFQVAQNQPDDRAP